MSITSMASFPHIETNLSDESVYVYANTRTYPLAKALIPTRAQKGRVGVPVWCDTAAELTAEFGDETKNILNKKYFSNDALFISEILKNNGCYIVRLAEPMSLTPVSTTGTTFTHNGIAERKGALKALQILEAVVIGNATTPADLIRYEREADGSFTTDSSGDKLPYCLDATGAHMDTSGAAYTAAKNTKHVAAAGSGETATAGVAGYDVIPGIMITWRWRYAYIPAADNTDVRETIANMKSYTTSIASEVINSTTANTKAYPMLVFEAASPGAWGNDNCLEFYYDSTNTRTESSLLGNVRYVLKPKHKQYNESTVVSYFDKRGYNSNSFVMEPDKVDTRYDMKVSLNDVLESSYDTVNPLPWNVTYFNENWLTVATLAQKYEKQYFSDNFDKTASAITSSQSFVNAVDDGLIDGDTDGVKAVDAVSETFTADSTDYKNQVAFYNAMSDYSTPWNMNIVSCVNLDNIPYYAVQNITRLTTNPTTSTSVGDDGITLYPYTAWRTADLSADIMHYGNNGRDGSLDDVDYEGWVRNFYNLTYQYDENDTTWNPKNIVDRGKYPFNMIYDTGYSMPTKKCLCNFLGTREDVKVILSTQTCTKIQGSTTTTRVAPTLNTMAQDESVAVSLNSAVQLMRESIVKGTSCCRATIFMHSGYLYSNYKGIVPLTLWSAIQSSKHYNTTSIKGTVKGWPNNKVDLFKQINWIAPDDEAHERHWNLGGNYVQAYDTDQLFIPSVRTVYTYDTSVLLDDEYTDAVVFTKQHARDSWATLVGRDDEKSVYEDLVTKDINQRLLNCFNGRYSFVVLAYQTEEEALRGYLQHVRIRLISSATKRAWIVDIVCNRAGYNTTAE